MDEFTCSAPGSGDCARAWASVFVAIVVVLVLVVQRFVV